MNTIGRILANINRQVIYLMVFLVVALPMILGIKAKVTITEPVEKAYKFIDSLPPGSFILIGIDYGPSTFPEMNPMLYAILRHAFKKDLKVGILALQNAVNIPIGSQVLRAVAKEYGKKYGVDFVNLGYKPGWDAVIVSIGREIRDVFPEDAFGTPLDSLPVTRNIHSYDDIALVIDLASGGTWASWIQFAQARFGVPVIIGVTAVMGPESYPYLQSGQIKGLLAGLKGAAEYETLINHPYLGVRGMPAQSGVHLLIILLILIGNLGYILQKRSRA